MDLKLKGKVALITGAGSGMGKHMAVEFAKEGAKIAVNDVNKDGIAETIKMVKAAGGEALRLIPSLNAHPAWVAAAVDLIREAAPQGRRSLPIAAG